MTRNVSYVNATQMEVSSRDTASGLSFRTNVLALPSISFPMSFAISVSVMIACVATVLNYLVLHALTKVNQSKLRSKFLIQTSCLADVAYAWANGSEVIATILMACGYRDDETHICFTGIYFTFYTITHLSQCLTSLALSLDRLYAVWKPLKYYTIGYNKTARLVFGSLPWLFSLLFWLPTIISPLMSQQTRFPTSNVACNILFNGFGDLSKVILGRLLAAAHSASFMSYIIVFIMLRWQQSNMKSLNDAKQHRQTTISLTITYLTISLGTLCLYLPSPIYNVEVLIPIRAVNDLDLHIYTRAIAKVLLDVYACNTIFTPLLLMVRIPAIKENSLGTFSFDSIEEGSRDDSIRGGNVVTMTSTTDTRFDGATETPGEFFQEEKM